VAQIGNLLFHAVSPTGNRPAPADYQSATQRSAAEPQRTAGILPAAAPDPVAREFVTSTFALGTRCGLQGRGPQNSHGSR